MSALLHLTRLTLKRDAAAIAPLIGVLAPQDPAEHAAVTHRLMWTLMPEEVRQAHSAGGQPAGGPAPFLWRADRIEGRYYLLGPRALDTSPYFHIETRPFEPALAPGARLAFTLRANATVDRKVGNDASGKAIRKRSDVVMDHLHAEERGGETLAPRAERREVAASAAAEAWLSAQGATNGFRPTALSVDGYHVLRLPRRGRPAVVGVLDLDGIIEIGDPQKFTARLVLGFGRAKAFGCGLMLIRRVP